VHCDQDAAGGWDETELTLIPLSIIQDLEVARRRRRPATFPDEKTMT
jgi:hypothetical protein